MSKTQPMAVLFDGEEFFVSAPGSPRNSPGAVLLVAQKFALENRDLTAADIGRTIACPFPVTLGIPAGLPATFYCYVAQSSAGSVQFVAGRGVTVNGATTPVAHPATAPVPNNTALPGYLPAPGALLDPALVGQIMVQATAQDVYRIMVPAPGGPVNA